MQLNKAMPTKSANALAAPKGTVKRGRKATTLTDEQKQNLLDGLGAGVPMSICAELIGVAETTLRKALARDGELQRLAFSKKGEAVKNHLQEIAKSKQWTARAWILERTMPEQFGQRRVEPVREATTNIIQVFQGKPSDKLKTVHAVDCD